MAVMYPALHPSNHVPPPPFWSSTQTRTTYGGLCGVLACGQAVGCVVSATRRSSGVAPRACVCVCVRASCAGAADYLIFMAYIHTRRCMVYGCGGRVCINRTRATAWAHLAVYIGCCCCCCGAVAAVLLMPRYTTLLC